MTEKFAQDRRPPAPRGHAHGVVLIAVPGLSRGAAIRAALSPLGCEIVTVRDGGEAQAELERGGPPLLLVTDLSLPKVDGFALLFALRRVAPAPRSAAIALSGHAGLRAAANRLANPLGLSAILPADVDASTLLGAATEALETVSSGRPSATRMQSSARASEAPRPDDAVEHAILSAARRFRAATTAVYLRRGEQEDVRGYFANLGVAPPLDAPHGLTFLRQLSLGRDTLIVPAAADHPALDELLPAGVSVAGGFAATPVAASPSGISGTLCVIDTKPLDLDAGDLEALETIGRDLSVALGDTPPRLPQPVAPAVAATATVDIDSLERLASADPLTGLANRRGGERDISAEISRARRQGTPLSCVLLDIDHFKGVNDTFGHQAGDHVLREISALLRRTVRAYDILVRWGGEEFLIVLPGVEQPQAFKLAERIRVAVEHLPIAGIGGVTASVGVSTLGADYSFDAMFAAADRRLYAAKAAGRNTVA